MTFSEKVKEIRSELGKTQDDLSKEVGVSLRSILAYEKGEKYPRRGTMLKLAKALGVSTKFLTDDDCLDPYEDLSKDGYLVEARTMFGSTGEVEVDKLLSANNALFAGGNLSQEQKDQFFEAIMKSYILCKETAKKKAEKK